jgi:hypothetical protein
MANNILMDADEIAARFYLVSKSIAHVKAGTLTLNGLSNALTAPVKTDLDAAKLAMVNPSTQVAGVITCNPCVINGKKYYGLTPSQCLAMGGKCISSSHPKEHKGTKEE